MTKNNGAAGKARPDTLLSPIRTLTVGSGITPDLLTFKPAGLKRSRAFGLSRFTAGGEFRPALRISI